MTHRWLLELHRSWNHRHARLAGWLGMCVGVTLGDVVPSLAPLAATLVVVGFAFSRLWHWRTDPIEREAQLDRRAARDSRVLRWGEICAGGLFLAQLAAYALDRELIAACFALAVVVCVVATLRIDDPFAG